MTLADKVHAFRLHLFRRAQAIGVSAACRELGVSRSLYYQLRKRFARYGVDGLHPKRTQGRPGRPPELDAGIERLVIGWALAWPTWGPQRLADQLGMRGTRVAATTVYRTLRRHGLGMRRERLAVLERHSAESAGLLTERTRRALEKARPMASNRHVEATAVGELVCLDCFYIGALKGVGRVWQITACDAFSSYGLAWTFVGEPTAAMAARFLREHLVPHFREAGWPLQRLLTDGGSEFKGTFAETCHALGIRHTRTKPRHAWTTGFVERLQQTILHEHWRIDPCRPGRERAEPERRCGKVSVLLVRNSWCPSTRIASVGRTRLGRHRRKPRSRPPGPPGRDGSPGRPDAPSLCARRA